MARAESETRRPRVCYQISRKLLSIWRIFSLDVIIFRIENLYVIGGRTSFTFFNFCGKLVC